MGQPVELQLDSDYERAKKIVMCALESTDSISEYYDDDRQIIAKTGSEFPWFSYGESVTISFENRRRVKPIQISVAAEKESTFDIEGNPEKPKREFLTELNLFRDIPEKKLDEYLHSKERNLSRKLVDDKSNLHNPTITLIKSGIFLGAIWVIVLFGINNILLQLTILGGLIAWGLARITLQEMKGAGKTTN